jgi:hypothetical protein
MLKFYDTLMCYKYFPDRNSYQYICFFNIIYLIVVVVVIVFIVCSVSFIVRVVLCALFCLSVVCM